MPTEWTGSRRRRSPRGDAFTYPIRFSDTGAFWYHSHVEVVRFYATNVSNARVINLKIDRRGIKVLGSDNGRYERPIFSANEYIAPGERSILEVLLYLDSLYLLIRVLIGIGYHFRQDFFRILFSRFVLPRHDI